MEARQGQSVRRLYGICGAGAWAGRSERTLSRHRISHGRFRDYLARGSRSFAIKDVHADDARGSRSNVTIAARALQHAGLIDYHRGVVTILDRDGLEAAACECYATIRDEFIRLLG